MQISNKSDLLEATINDHFEFDNYRELLLSCNAHAALTENARVIINFESVRHVNSCAIGVLLVLSESMPGGIRINLRHCGDNVMSFFNSGLLDKYFSGCPNGLPASSYCSCFENNRPTSDWYCGADSPSLLPQS
ncbi:hypothetical protein ACH50O_23310 (plasmid) [Methylomonas sp. 2BW1-5-20]|uniref:hypothetical protein n=1 Tax=Methylomonas sp. 2BW1-5-20 TaxID=3376686 RepID=UPI00404F0D52